MDISLEVWNGPGRATDRLHLASACAQCQANQERTFDRCRKRRSYLARNEAPVPEVRSEDCAFKQRLTRVATTQGGPVLFAFGYDNPREGATDSSVVSFLGDMQAMLEPGDDAAAPEGDGQHATARNEPVDLLQVGNAPDRPRAQTWNQEVLEQWRATAHADLAFVWRADDTIVAAFQSSGEALPSPLPDSLQLFARRQGQELLSTDSDVQRSQLEASHPVSKFVGGPAHVTCIALQTDGDRTGMLCGVRASAFPTPTEVEAQLLRSLSRELALRWSNADLLQGLKRFLVNTVKTLVSAIDAKDSYTSGHSERVNIISMLLGHELDLDLVDLEALYWGALLHDVGKIGMPEAILNKPSPLEQDEFRIVRDHPERGWRMLYAVPELERAADGIRYHHERWDGGGYPRGLAGDAIPMLSRIICVADAFDAIVSNRSYRKGQSPTRAVEMIEECAGTQFDPDVVAALRRLLPLLEKHRWVLMSGKKTSFHY